MSSEESLEEGTWEVETQSSWDTSSVEDEWPDPSDNPDLWICQMKYVKPAIRQLRMVYAELLSQPNVLQKCQRRELQGFQMITCYAREQLHNCVQEICKLWNRTKLVCVRERICELGKVHWDVHRRLKMAAVYDLLELRQSHTPGWQHWFHVYAH